jgi:CRP-like cAMP-binding protein
MQERFQFFRALGEKEILDFLRFCETRSVPSGRVLWSEGDTENYTAFIVSGRIGIKKKTEFEKEQVIIGLYGEGSVVGELCLLTDNARSVTAEVLEPAELVILESSRFEQMLSEHPTLGLKLLKHIFLTTCKRLRKSYDRIASIF